MHSRRTGRRKHNFSLSLTALLLVSPALAIWPFPPKRFTGNTLIDAGSMGLDDDGRVIAFGDFNGDQLYVRADIPLIPNYDPFP